MAKVHAPRFVGRRTELQHLIGLLGTARQRLVTVTGPPGIGKSTLAAQATAPLREDFEHGAVPVDLAPVSDPNLLPAAIANALGVRETPDRSAAAQLRTFLATRRMLLVLDNFEHLKDASPLVEDLLASASGLQILVTSRVPLQVPAEYVLPLEPLALPRRSDLAAVVRAPASELFVARAQERHPQFAVTPENAAAVAEICARLEGVPLAIELAAARVGPLPPDVLAEQLRRPLGILAAADAEYTSHHRTMRDAIAWSDSLLNPLERRVFSRLAVFAGGCLIDAAQAVCVDLGAPGEIRSALQVLTDHNLVHTVQGGARLLMFETMREYGLAQLAAAGEIGDIRRRHAGWVLQLAERAEPRLQGPEQATWLQRLDDEQENLRTALGWALEAGEAELALRLAGAVWWFWYVRGRFSEGRRWLEPAAAMKGGPPAPRMKVLSGAAGLATLQGDVAAGAAFAAQARELAEALADPDGAGHALMNLGAVALRARDFDAAAARLEESARLFLESGNKWGRACAFVNLHGLVRRRGEAERAQAMLEESVSLLREVGDKMCGASAVNALAKQALAGGDVRRAAVLYRESLVYAKELGSTLGLAQSMEGLAATAAPDAPYYAAVLLGASEAVRKAGGVSLPPHVQMDRDKTAAALKVGLTDEQVDAAWAAGRDMPLDEAAAFALAGPQAPGRRAGPLTAREAEVAALVAEGLTNRQIATMLFITERTAENHIQHVMNKLGVNSRTQVAVWASTRGLHAKK